MRSDKLVNLGSFAALTFALLLAGTTLALAAECTTEDLTGEVFFNECDGTTVTFSTGSVKTCQQVVADGSGGQHELLTLTLHGRGDGSNGNKYILNATLHVTENQNSGGARSHTQTFPVDLIGQGNAPSFRCRITVHITVNADGTISATFERRTTDCLCLL